jgi:hypothetical protein
MQPMVFGWRPKSKSAIKIAAALGAEFTHRDSDYEGKRGQVCINWGAGWNAPQHGSARIINRPEAIARAVNKLDTFRILNAAKVPTPEWTTDPIRAWRWISQGHTIFGRQELEAKAGKGIILLSNKPFRADQVGAQVKGVDDILRHHCQAYTKKFDAKWEFKIHVAFGQVRWIWEIAEDKADWSDQDGLIRNYDNGYYFRYASRALQAKLKKVVFTNCENAIKALGLDFGVCDIGVAKNGKDMVIYEINTAPAVDEYDASLYAKMFRRELKLK